MLFRDSRFLTRIVFWDDSHEKVTWMKCRVRAVSQDAGIFAITLHQKKSRLLTGIFNIS